MEELIHYTFDYEITIIGENDFNDKFCNFKFNQ
jgi:hypothetical protein